MAFFDRKKSINRDRKRLDGRNSVREQSTLSFLSTLSEIAGNNRVLTLLETFVTFTSFFHYLMAAIFEFFEIYAKCKCSFPRIS